MQNRRVTADIGVSERGVETIDFETGYGHRGDAFTLLERLLPSLRDLDRAIKADPATREHA